MSYSRIKSLRLQASRDLELSYWGLQGLTEGRPVTLYHGSTATFTRFSPALVRDKLVDKFYGSGIFLTPSKRVAEQYADANRNIGFPPSIIGELKRQNPDAGEFLGDLYKRGNSAWDDYDWDTAEIGGVDPNTLGDIAAYILGSKIKPINRGSGMLFDTKTGAPDWLYDDLDEVGLDSSRYRPKVYTVSVRVKNPLVTKSKSLAKKARAKGYDSVVYYGPGIVGGVPEVAVFDPTDVSIKKWTLVR